MPATLQRHHVLQTQVPKVTTSALLEVRTDDIVHRSKTTTMACGDLLGCLSGRTPPEPQLLLVVRPPATTQRVAANWL